MGAIGGGIGKVVGGAGSLVNGVLKPFGLGGDQGAYVQGPDMAATNKALTDYTNFLQDPTKSYNNATQEVMNNDLTKGVYGQGGLQSQLATEGNNLANQGFSLQQPDYTAYGQAAGNIARQFGQQENDTASALARRGLGGGSSGAAGAAFSGLQGNKNEMLAQAQQNIAQQRYQDTMQRLNQNRQLQSQLANQGSELAQNQFNNTGKSLGENYNIHNAAAQQAYENQRQVMNDQQAAQGQTLFGQIGKGIGGAIGNLGSVWGGSLAGRASAGGSGNTFQGANGGAISSIGSMFSDENNKTNIKDGTSEVHSMLEHLSPHSYIYKESVKNSPFADHSRHVSPMAQELEKSSLGSSMVEDTPEGKVVHYGKGLGAMLAATSDLHKRVKTLEKGLS